MPKLNSGNEIKIRVDTLIFRLIYTCYKMAKNEFVEVAKVNEIPVGNTVSYFYYAALFVSPIVSF